MDRLTNQASENSFSDKAIVDGAYSTYCEEVPREVEASHFCCAVVLYVE
jgi:hypothetical protein